MQENQLLQVVNNLEIIQEHLDIFEEINEPNPTIHSIIEMSSLLKESVLFLTNVIVDFMYNQIQLNTFDKYNQTNPIINQQMNYSMPQQQNHFKNQPMQRSLPSKRISHDFNQINQSNEIKEIENKKEKPKTIEVPDVKQKLEEIKRRKQQMKESKELKPNETRNEIEIKKQQKETKEEKLKEKKQYEEGTIIKINKENESYQIDCSIESTDRILTNLCQKDTLSQIGYKFGSHEFKRIYKSKQNELNLPIDDFTKKKMLILIETIDTSIFGFIMCPKKRNKKGKKSQDLFGSIYFVSMVNSQDPTFPLQLLQKKNLAQFITNYKNGENGMVEFDNTFILTTKEIIPSEHFKETFNSVFDFEVFVDLGDKERIEVNNVELFEFM